MPLDNPHKAAFIDLMREDRSAANYLAGYIAGSVSDALLCAAIQSWRTHEAHMADLEKRQDLADELEEARLRD
jgi:hypothetical protein